MQSKVEVLERKESLYSEASFKNALKNEEAEKKKKDKSDDDDEELTDEEKDALDYQLQRAMDMVRAMSKLQARASIVPATPDDPIAMEIETGDDSAKLDDKKSDDKKTDKK